MIIFIFGPPGSGKGVQSKLLHEQFGFEHISSGDLLRKEVCSGSERGQQIAKIMKAGDLIDDATTIQLIVDHLSTFPANTNFILDGSPRTLNQVFLLEEKGILPQIIINLKVDEETLVERLRHRRVCCNCHAIYNLLSAPPKEDEICDKCSSALMTRPDDHEEVIRKRFALYRESVEEILKFYEKSYLSAWVSISDIEVTTIERTFNDIKQILPKI